MRYLAVLIFLATIFTALPAHTELYAKDKNPWEGDWEYDNNLNDENGDYKDNGGITIENCKKNICEIIIGTTRGPDERYAFCSFSSHIKTTGNKAVIFVTEETLDENGAVIEDSAREYAEFNEYTGSSDSAPSITDCMSFVLDKEGMVLNFTVNEECYLSQFCGSRAYFYTQQMLNTKDGGLNSKTYPTSYDCKKITSRTEKIICQNKELAALDIELNDIYIRLIKVDATITAGQREWLIKRNALENSEVPAEDLKTLYAERIQELRTEATNKAAYFHTSYDCLKTLYLAEETVCETETLANLDLELAKLYKKAIGKSPKVKTAQREWIKKRDDCTTDKDCLEHEYKRRIIELYKVLRTKK